MWFSPIRNVEIFWMNNNWLYYISKLVRALWLVNLAGRTLLHGPLKFKVLLLKLLHDLYRQIFSTYIANKSLKLSFILNCVLKRANNLKTISNWFVLLSTWFRKLKPFLMNGNRYRCRTLQTYNRDTINILLTSSSRSYDLWPARFALGPEIEGEKPGP